MTDEQKILFEKYNLKFKLNNEVSNILARDEKLSSFFENAYKELSSTYNQATMQLLPQVSILANYVANDVAKQLKDKSLNELKFSVKEIIQLVKMVDDETISSKIAKQVFEQMSQTGEEPKQIVEDKGLIQISDTAIILPIIDEVIENNPQNVQKFKDGNSKLLGFFVGQVLKATLGKANPKVVNELVAKKLQS